jgi:hypothetical protein
MKMFWIAAILTLIVAGFIGLSRPHTESTTTALDLGNEQNRITGRVYRRGFGWPMVYLETAEFQESVVGQPTQADMDAVREAGRSLMEGFDAAGRRWNVGGLLVDVLAYSFVAALVGVLAQLVSRVVA